MFGAGLIVPVPDIDRTDHLLLLGANPYESNGSLATAPDWPGRHRGAAGPGRPARRRRPAPQPHRRGGRRVGRRSGPAPTPSCWRRWSRTLLDEGLVDLGDVAPYVAGLDGLGAALAPVHARGRGRRHRRSTPRPSGASPASSPPPRRAAVYGRIGTTTAEFGTLASWLVDVLNILTGNLDRPGGAMFTRAAAGASNTRGAPGVGRGVRLGRRHSRVRGLPESLGELPAVCLAEEIDTPGEGQVRALVTVAGNPVLSTPNGDRLDAALAGARVHGGGRHLRQRDHPPRRRDPPGALGARRRPTTTSRSCSSASATSPTGPSRCCRSTTASSTSGRCWPAWRSIAQGMGADADPAVVDDL